MSQLSYTLGVDPAKRKFTACLLNGNSEVFAPRDFDCSPKGFEELKRALPKDGRIAVGIEASASCDDNILAYLQGLGAERPITVIHVDPAQAKRFSGARPIRGKTDKADARRIAHFTRHFAEQLHRFELDCEAQGMLRLVNERMSLVGERSAVANKLHDRLIGAFPEAEKVLGNPTKRLGLAVLLQAPTARAAAKKQVKTLAEISPGKGCHRLGTERAEKLVKMAKVSIASALGPFEENAVRRLVSRLQLMDSQIQEIEEELYEYAAKGAAPQLQEDEEEEIFLEGEKDIVAGASPKSEPSADGAGEEPVQTAADADDRPLEIDSILPETELPPLTISEQIQLVSTIKGIGLVGASTIVLRTKGITRFVKAKALAAQMGTCPDRSQTGSSRDTASLTSRGDRLVRGLLYQLTLVATKHDPAMSFHFWYAKKRGLLPKQALCACMNRMARIIYGVVKSRKPYSKIKALNNIKTHHPALWIKYLQERENSVKKVENNSSNTVKGALT
jgi:transposase